MNEEIQQSSKNFLDMSADLLKQRQIKKNIDQTIEELETCRFVLSLIDETNTSIEQKNYHSSLKLLSELQVQYLPRVHEYSFAKYYEAKIPLIKEKLRKDVTSDISQWLLNIRNRSEEIGRDSLALTVKQLAEEEREKNNEDSSSKDQSEADLFEKLGINFRPLYQALHIYDSLGSKDEFQNYYTENRRIQLHNILQHFSGQKTTLTNSEKCLNEIGGFFLIEDVVRQTTHLISSSTYEDTWEATLRKVKSIQTHKFEDLNGWEVKIVCRLARKNYPALSVLEKGGVKGKDENAQVLAREELLELKVAIKKFVAFGKRQYLDVKALEELLDNLREKYSELSAAACGLCFLKIFQDDSYEPLNIKQNDPMYQRLIVINGLEAYGIVKKGKKSQVQFTFSQSVPYCYLLIKFFIDDLRDFGSDLKDHPNFSIFVDGVLETLAESVVSHVKGPGRNLLRSIRMILNTRVFISSCAHFEDLLVKLKINMEPLKARKKFEAANKSCLDNVQQLINDKIDDFISLASNINWAPPTHSPQPRNYIQDIVMFLDSSFEFMNDLDRETIELFVTSSYKHLAQQLTGLFESNEVVRFNTNAVKNFEADIKYLVDSIQRSSHPNNAKIMDQPLQLARLLLSDIPSDFLDDSIRTAQFNKLTNFASLAKIVSKYRDDEESYFGAGFGFTKSLFGRGDAAVLKKRSLEALARGLKEKV
eukprot:TRINITY_DN5033_c0_g1_i2.p1 TRINITY_DN5033_c0_g1~~TRINITY_DN5033_c0_g1_i2.p1  ORF type:complete len:794 (-),score=165.25 TRINITY_DN5033_c0_g1_i2:44-2158(-)